jgi:hypothetical protein
MSAVLVIVALAPVVAVATAASVGVSSAAVVLVGAAVVSVGWTAVVAVADIVVGVGAASCPQAASKGSRMRLAAKSPADFFIENILTFLL